MEGEVSKLKVEVGSERGKDRSMVDICRNQGYGGVREMPGYLWGQDRLGDVHTDVNSLHKALA